MENQPFRTINNHNGSSDRDEISFSSENNIYIYTNSNNNSFTYSQTVSLSEDVIDFEIADVNNDGWNDILVVAQNSDASSRYMKVFLNNGSGTISSTAIFSITSNVIKDCKISTGDFNKDGWNDIVMGGRDTISVFENIKGSNLFSTSNIVNYTYNTPTISLPKKIMVADLTNLGGLSVLFSGKTQTLYESDPGWIYENVIRINPSVKDANPAPPIIFKDYAPRNGIYMPKIKIYQRGDRDFEKFKIYKKTTAYPDSIIYLGETNSNVYIDSTEGLIESPQGAVPSTYNLFYHVRSVDLTSHESINSDTVKYYAYQLIEDGGNIISSNQESTNSKLIQKFSITNYPNPYNPVTKIYFTIPVEGNVKITVFNSIGQEVIKLVNEFKQSGRYNIEFNGSNLSSGIYYYRIEAGSFVQTKKMLLIK